MVPTLQEDINKSGSLLTPKDCSGPWVGTAWGFFGAPWNFSCYFLMCMCMFASFVFSTSYSVVVHSGGEGASTLGRSPGCAWKKCRCSFGALHMFYLIAKQKRDYSVEL
ncbi:unnamed protein product [Ostreobium quekettii]|uniref:Uncharacterized protein n=1 Tax=Ostreobium quekettii TaxID=121088 RepID=A0A8S1IZK3_9CHLO|nr:unnamed protein product [Ostreobium quekettii]